MRRLIGMVVLAGVGLAVSGTDVRAAEDCALRVGWQVWAPYQMKGAGQMKGAAEPEGLDIAMVREVAGRAGCDLTFERMPWSRLLGNIERGEMDVALASSRNETRAAYARFTDPYRQERVGVMVRAGDTAIQEMDSLEEMIEAGRRFGVWRDYHYGDKVERLRADPDYAQGFHVTYEGETLMRMLAAGRIDASLGDPVADAYTAETLGVADAVTVHDLTVLETPVHFMLSRDSVPVAVVARLNAAIRAARADGTLADLKAAHLPADLPTAAP